jgi:hypothetical protein
MTMMNPLEGLLCAMWKVSSKQENVVTMGAYAQGTAHFLTTLLENVQCGLWQHPAVIEAALGILSSE